MITKTVYLGYFTHVTTLAEVKEQVLKYIPVMARPLVLMRETHPVRWTGVYADIEVRRKLHRLQADRMCNRKCNNSYWLIGYGLWLCLALKSKKNYEPFLFDFPWSFSINSFLAYLVFCTCQ